MSGVQLITEVRIAGKVISQLSRKGDWMSPVVLVIIGARCRRFVAQHLPMAESVSRVVLADQTIWTVWSSSVIFFSTSHSGPVGKQKEHVSQNLLPAYLGNRADLVWYWVLWWIPIESNEEGISAWHFTEGQHPDAAPTILEKKATRAVRRMWIARNYPRYPLWFARLTGRRSVTVMSEVAKINERTSVFHVLPSILLRLREL